MKFTRLVIEFNKGKIIFGLLFSSTITIFSFYLSNDYSPLLFGISLLVFLNIILALYASYQLFDKSGLYKPTKMFDLLGLKSNSSAILLHASFDPISLEFEKLFSEGILKTYNLYGNRHEDEKSVRVSNRIFPPNPNEKIVKPTDLPEKDNSIDYILAIVSLHEISPQENRIRFFEEARRIMKDDGCLIICEQLRNLTNLLFYNIGVFHFVSLNKWKDAINIAGLKIEKIQSLTLWGTIIIVNKA